MIVCICHRVSDRDIAQAVREGCHSFDQLQDELRVASACGACADCARDSFDAQRTRVVSTSAGRWHMPAPELAA